MKKLALVNVLLLTMVFMSSCLSEIAQADKMKEIRKVAVLSLASNPGIYNYNEPVMGGILTQIASVMAVSQQYNDTLYQELTAQIQKLGWSALPQKDIVKTVPYLNIKNVLPTYYSDKIKVKNGSSRYAGLNHTDKVLTMTNQTYIEYNWGNEKKLNEGLIEYMGKVAQELNVDAVIIAYMDIAYQPSAMSIGGLGLGLARASVATSFVVVDRNGDIVILDFPVQDVERTTSKQNVGLVAGTIDPVNEKFIEMVKEAITTDVSKWIKAKAELLK